MPRERSVREKSDREYEGGEEVDAVVLPGPVRGLGRRNIPPKRLQQIPTPSSTGDARLASHCDMKIPTTNAPWIGECVVLSTMTVGGMNGCLTDCTLL